MRRNRTSACLPTPPPSTSFSAHITLSRKNYQNRDLGTGAFASATLLLDINGRPNTLPLTALSFYTKRWLPLHYISHLIFEILNGRVPLHRVAGLGRLSQRPSPLRDLNRGLYRLDLPLWNPQGLYPELLRPMVTGVCKAEKKLVYMKNGVGQVIWGFDNFMFTLVCHYSRGGCQDALPQGHVLLPH